MLIFPFSVMAGYIESSASIYRQLNECQYLSSLRSANKFKRVSESIDEYISRNFLRMDLLKRGSTEYNLNKHLKTIARDFITQFRIESDSLSQIDFLKNDSMTESGSLRNDLKTEQRFLNCCSLSECVFLNIILGLKEIKNIKIVEIENEIKNILKWLEIVFETEDNQCTSHRPKLIENLMREILPRIFNLSKILEMNRNSLVFHTEYKIRWLLNFLCTISQMVCDRENIKLTGFVKYRWVYQKIENIIKRECNKKSANSFFKKDSPTNPQKDKIDSAIVNFIYNKEGRNSVDIQNMIVDLIICFYMATYEINTPEQENKHFRAIREDIESIKRGRRPKKTIK